MTVAAPDLETRARQSLGSSSAAVYVMVRNALASRNRTVGDLVDVGCGGGHLRSFVQQYSSRYIGVDAVRYGTLPADIEFHQLDLDSGHIDLPGGFADIVAAGGRCDDYRTSGPGEPYQFAYQGSRVFEMLDDFQTS